MLQPEPPPDCPFGVVATAQPPVCGPVPPRPFGFAHAPAVRREIAALDARADCQRIVHLLATCEFPEDLLRSMELALFHTYGSRSVARLLDRTGEFRCRGQKRYDDTRLLIGQFIESGWDGEAGRRAIAQIAHFLKRQQDLVDPGATVLIEQLALACDRSGTRRAAEQACSDLALELLHAPAHGRAPDAEPLARAREAALRRDRNEGDHAGVARRKTRRQRIVVVRRSVGLRAHEP